MKIALRHRFRCGVFSLLPAGIVVLLLSTGCANVLERGPVTVEQIIEMSRNGTDTPIILAKIQEAGTVYRLSGSRLAMLRSEGVPDPVLDYMLQTYLRAERQRQVDNCAMGPPYFVLD